MGKCKAEGTEVHLGMFTHIHASSETIQAYSEPCVSLVYLEPLHN